MPRDILTNCPECGDVFVPPLEIRVIINAVSFAGLYQFECPSGSHPEVSRITGQKIGRLVCKPAERRIVDQLAARGCPIDRFDPETLPDDAPGTVAGNLRDLTRVEDTGDAYMHLFTDAVFEELLRERSE